MSSIRATYENGVFRPLEPVTLSEGAEVRVVFPDEVSEESIEQRLRLRYPNALGVLADDDANEMIQAIEEEFEKVDQNDWR